jgi:hypothetical protein
MYLIFAMYCGVKAQNTGASRPICDVVGVRNILIISV